MSISINERPRRSGRLPGCLALFFVCFIAVQLQFRSPTNRLADARRATVRTPTFIPLIPPGVPVFPPQCSEEDLATVSFQLPDTDCRNPAANGCSFSYASRCPQQELFDVRDWNASKSNASIVLREYSDSYVLLIHDECSGAPRTSIPHDRLGANEYLIQFDGPELHALVPEHVGNCSYQAQWSTSRTGAYTLSITKLRSQYEAIAESEPLWPELHFDTLLRVSLNATSPQTTSCSKQGVWSMVGEEGILKEFHQVKKRSPGVFTNIGLNAINDTHDTSSGNKMAWKVTMGHNKSAEKKVCPPLKKITNFKFKTCTHFQINDRDWKAMSVLFSGDSNSRVAFIDLLLYLDIAPLESISSESGLHCVRFEKGNRWCVGTNNLGSCSTFRSLHSKQDWNLVIINFGQHHASKHRRTFSDYSSTVDQAVQCVKDFDSQVLWMSSPPVPLRSDDYVRKVGDWRTVHRLKAFNAYANAAFAEAGFPVIDNFEAMLPLIDKMEDDAHYSYLGTHQLLAQTLAKYAPPLESLAVAGAPAR